MLLLLLTAAWSLEASPVKRQIDIRAQAFPKDDMEDRELVKLFEKRDDCSAELDAPGMWERGGAGGGRREKGGVGMDS